MKKLLVLTSLLISVNSFAGNRESGGIGPTGTYANCTGLLESGDAVSFEVRSTAIPTFIDSVLVNTDTNKLIVQLECKKGKNIVEKTPSAGKVEWLCTEYAHVDDGDISVELIRGGVTGVLTGQIKQKQMFPLPAQIIGTLSCEN